MTNEPARTAPNAPAPARGSTRPVPVLDRHADFVVCARVLRAVSGKWETRLLKAGAVDSELRELAADVALLADVVVALLEAGDR